MRSTMLLSAAAAVLSFASAAKADWASADAAFGQRDGNRAKMAEARNEYLNLLSSSTDAADKIRAVSQLGRLAIFEGEMTLPKTATAERKSIFEQCWKTIADAIKPGTNGIGENPSYYYVKGVCLAYWGEAAGPLASLPHVPMLKDLIAKGMALDTRFEGGGIFRLAGGVYSNKQAQAVGLYKPEEALGYAQSALQQSAYPGDPSSGAEYYDNWRGLALCQDENGLKNDAKATLEEQIAVLDELAAAGELPAGREPEARWNLAQMKAHLAKLNN